MFDRAYLDLADGLCPIFDRLASEALALESTDPSAGPSSEGGAL